MENNSASRKIYPSSKAACCAGLQPFAESVCHCLLQPVGLLQLDAAAAAEGCFCRNTAVGPMLLKIVSRSLKVELKSKEDTREIFWLEYI